MQTFHTRKKVWRSERNCFFFENFIKNWKSEKCASILSVSIQAKVHHLCSSCCDTSSSNVSCFLVWTKTDNKRRKQSRTSYGQPKQLSRRCVGRNHRYCIQCHRPRDVEDDDDEATDVREAMRFKAHETYMWSKRLMSIKTARSSKNSTAAALCVSKTSNKIFCSVLRKRHTVSVLCQKYTMQACSIFSNTFGDKFNACVGLCVCVLSIIMTRRRVPIDTRRAFVCLCEHTHRVDGFRKRKHASVCKVKFSVCTIFYTCRNFLQLKNTFRASLWWLFWMKTCFSYLWFNPSWSFATKKSGILAYELTLQLSSVFMLVCRV